MSSDIDWIEAAENYVQLHTGRARASAARHHEHAGEISRPGLFLRIHRSVIVNVTRIKELQPVMHGEYVITLSNGVRLQSGRMYKEKLKALAANPFQA